MPRPLLLLLGDSITQGGSDWTRGGWICRLMDRYSRSVDIAQRGMSGYSTQSFMNLVVDKLAHDLSTSLRPQLITLFLGANDAALLTGPGAPQHVPLPKYKTNLRYLLQLFRERAPQAKVLLITPPAVDESVGNWGRTNNATGEYAKAMVQVAKERNVAVLDLHTVFNALPETQWKGMLKDGLHFNQKGNEFMEQQLVDTIKTTFPALQKQLDQKEYPQDWLATQAPSPWPWPPWSPLQEGEQAPLAADPSQHGGGQRNLMGVSPSEATGSVDASSLFAVPVMLACAVLVGIAAVVGRRRVRAANAKPTVALP